MKRLIAIILVLCLMLPLAGCKKDEEETPEYTAQIDAELIEENATKGVIPEIPFGIGASIDEVKAHYVEESEDGKYDTYDETTQGEYVRIRTDEALYYYDKQNTDDGVLAIICYNENVYNFVIGQTPLADVRYFLGNGYEENPEESEIFYLPPGGMAGTPKTLTYSYGEYGLRIVFSDSTLFAVILFNNSKFDFSKGEREI